MMHWLHEARRLLGSIAVLPRRMRLDTGSVPATIPMLRGVWGAALYHLDGGVYGRVFDPPTCGASRGTPLYVLRPAVWERGPEVAVDWILFGSGIDDDVMLRRAWDVASGMGLGRRRQRFFIRRYETLGPDGRSVRRQHPWSLSQVDWPMERDQACRLVFRSPLRLLRRGRLIRTPTISDIVVACCRRVSVFLGEGDRACWERISRGAIEVAKETPCGKWVGRRHDLHRYSARQKATVELRGVSGWLDLPQGPGDLWPILAAAQWLHIGKGAVMGMGRLQIDQV